MTLLEWTLLITLSIVWGGSFFFNEVALRDLPTLTVVFARVALAAVILLAVCRVAGVPIPVDLRVWQAFVVMGLLNNVVPFTLIVWGQTHIASGVASILNAATPLFTVVVAHYLTADEKLTKQRAFGVLAGFVGVTILIGVDTVRALGVDIAAQLACLGAALSYAFAGVFGRRFRRLGVPPLATATGQVTVSSLLLLPLMLAVDQPWTLAAPGLAAIAAVIGIAALSTAFAYVLYFRILATAGATNLLLVTLLVPVSATLLGITILGERLALQHVLGMACIGLGLAAIDGRALRLLRLRGARRQTEGAPGVPPTES